METTELRILSKANTRQLLAWLDNARKCDGATHPDVTGHSFSMESLKAELAKRPHVPNKKESKELRKAKMLRNRTKDRGRRGR